MIPQFAPKAYLIQQAHDCFRHCPQEWSKSQKMGFVWQSIAALIRSNHRDLSYSGKGSKFRAQVWIRWNAKGGFGCHPTYSRPLLNDGGFSY